jgi:hypothetical protein
MWVSDQLTPLPLSPWRMSPRYSLDSRLGGPPSGCRRCGVDTNCLSLSGIDPRLPSTWPIAIPAELFRLPLEGIWGDLLRKSSSVRLASRVFSRAVSFPSVIAATIMKHCLQMASTDRLYSIIFRLYSLSSLLLSSARKGEWRRSFRKIVLVWG